jgi:hypothetical protein
MADITHVTYWSSQPDETMPTELSLDLGKAATLWLRCNRDQPTVAVLGRFTKPLPAAETDPLIRLLGSAEFQGVQNPPPALPGEVMRRITVKTSDGKQVLKFVAEGAAAPPPFAQAEGLLLKLAEATRAHPQQALSLALEPVPSAGDAKTPFTFKVVLSNPGTEPVRISLPKGWAASSTELEWRGVRSDIPLAQLSNDHSKTVKPGLAHVVNPPPEDWKTLAPGASASLELKASWVGWTPGEYDLQFAYVSSLRDKDAKEATRFEWVTPKSRLVIKKE